MTILFDIDVTILVLKKTIAHCYHDLQFKQHYLITLPNTRSWVS